MISPTWRHSLGQEPGPEQQTHSGGWALSHQVVKEDVGGLSGQIADVQQQLPQHVDQLILETQQQLGKVTLHPLTQNKKSLLHSLLMYSEEFGFFVVAAFMS